MLNVAPIWLAFICCLSEAASFNDRLAHADAACELKEGQLYLQSIYKHVGEVSDGVLTHCFESIPSADKSGFVVVADVHSTGKLAAISTRPSTNLSACFARALEAETFERPPAGKYQQSFPIVLNMDATSLPPNVKCLRRQR